MSRILLLDLDHTLYPSTAPTLKAVDERITHFIATRLGLPQSEADAMRQSLCGQYGTTLRGLELLHGVSREEYTDFIQDLEDALMPLADPRLRAWLIEAAHRHPTYLFTNARRDWADRCLTHLGLADLVATGDPAITHAIRGILDIDFMEWVGKPDASAFFKVEAFLRAQGHSEAAVAEPVFVDDRLDNLAAADARGWRTVWVRPHDFASDAPAGGASPARQAINPAHRIVDSLLELDPETLE